ncbi:3-hydroxyisobutyrate dehydrogenase [Acetobacter nitrogenifigens DSM 23921 = NBRC 105050]|uniref:3-hydroxyisobutyrate dehydrogenase n=1 Tax=Acetobacter nitrogenifigens DSM 23921 = NBRC 105050 TaxID=1120919 RepID=A0A511XBJ3_9PROT|nr:NAD(P)-dependent oxidoreductase [Acetobacter nitrogenifigens]GBQ90778.1 3-hydroxyisobutyrate dehydrogenase [Acetobacter nitrogenifigens DSM 23921 = NBRC 105050]GEN60255.1 3-hydroxyisobutyrate dehydrogenase [Acetobacter nitrogenifigens DSM 23921 = NBRC 105050]
MSKIGVVGLGNMGRGMAASLMRKGFDVLGHDPFLDGPLILEGRDVSLATSLSDVTHACDVIVLSLPTAAVVEQVIAGEGGVLASGRAGVTVIDTSTSHPDVTRRLAKLIDEAGMHLVDAPVSGGPSGAMAGALGMVLGGDAADIARIEPVLEAMSRVRTHVGAVGDGHALKIINNVMCGANLILAAEALALGRSLGMQDDKLVAGLNSGSGRNAATEVNMPRWILNQAFDSGFTMKLMRKDIRLGDDLARRSELTLPLMEQTIAAWADSAPTLADQADFNRIVEMTLDQTSVTEAQ